MKQMLATISLAVAVSAGATPVEATCQRDANEQRMTGQARAAYLQRCRKEQGMPAAVALCERYLANKSIPDGHSMQHAMQLCFLEHLHPGNGPYTPPARAPDKNYKSQ